jgi:hypothetical protein
MTIIDEVAAKLRGAQRAVKKARATYENAAADAPMRARSLHGARHG